MNGPRDGLTPGADKVGDGLKPQHLFPRAAPGRAEPRRTTRSVRTSRNLIPGGWARWSRRRHSPAGQGALARRPAVRSAVARRGPCGRRRAPRRAAPETGKRRMSTVVERGACVQGSVTVAIKIRIRPFSYFPQVLRGEIGHWPFLLLDLTGQVLPVLSSPTRREGQGRGLLAGAVPGRQGSWEVGMFSQLLR